MARDDANATVEVVYATPDEQRIVTVAHSADLTAAAAAEASGLLDTSPEIRSRPLVLGVYGERVDADHVLRPGDRVEICRPLHRDPRELRRERLADER